MLQLKLLMFFFSHLRSYFFTFEFAKILYRYLKYICNCLRSNVAFCLNQCKLFSSLKVQCVEFSGI